MPRFPKIFSQKNKKPNKLNLFEMWNLYSLVGDGYSLPDVLDESIETLKNLSPFEIKKIMKLLYPKYETENSLETALLFMKGLKENKFFDFQYLLRMINGRAKR